MAPALILIYGFRLPGYLVQIPDGQSLDRNGMDLEQGIWVKFPHDLNEMPIAPEIPAGGLMKDLDSAIGLDPELLVKGSVFDP
jgi:hypothetical protein